MNLSQDQRTIASQRVRIEELEEELRQTRQNAVPVVLFPTEWRLTRAQERILAAFSKAPEGLLSNEQLFIAADSKATEADNVIKVQIGKLRKKVEALGIKITNRWGYGYEVAPETRDFLTAVIERRAMWPQSEAAE